MCCIFNPTVPSNYRFPSALPCPSIIDFPVGLVAPTMASYRILDSYSILNPTNPERSKINNRLFLRSRIRCRVTGTVRRPSASASAPRGRRRCCGRTMVGPRWEIRDQRSTEIKDQTPPTFGGFGYWTICYFYWNCSWSLRRARYLTRLLISHTHTIRSS